ncbi:hypothetical protein DAPPUDRAFT_242029 [Daphnia pulex]|uniref:Uncharacterized protein n=1 Tax=Daphnia pulex TaxID=6669 RepID=E9GFP1_DAPPU|nr:hypothetical protein DAPPUDRAFT_242029 [Daphnia pulex]|eukprot:EFX81667.1 hypothetical protein DAPPUDRAFT_242029 [Daphnia pulex]
MYATLRPVQSHVLIPSIELDKKTEMNPEASRYGNHSIHHIQIPEGFVPVLAAQCGVMLQSMLVKDLNT